MRHRDIQERDVRPGQLRLSHGLAPIGRFRDHGKSGLAFEQQPEASPHHVVIVRQQDTNLFQGFF